MNCPNSTDQTAFSILSRHHPKRQINPRLLDAGAFQDGVQPVFLRFAMHHNELAVVGLLHAGEDFQQAGFARAVAPDQADFVARGELERCFVEQRDVPEGEG